MMHALLLAAVAITRVACVGDEITLGVGLPGGQSYPDRLGRLLGATNYVVSFGREGATLRDGGEIARLREFRPDVVIVMLGSNDAAPDVWRERADEFVPAYKGLVERLRALPSRPQVWLCTPPPATARAAGARDTVAHTVAPLVRQAARESGAGLIDVFRALEVRDELFSRDGAPNADGAAVIAETVAAAVAPQAQDKARWRVVSVTSQEPGEGDARFAIDGDSRTYWHTRWSSNATRNPHEIVVDMGEEIGIAGVRYLPRQDGGINGRVTSFDFATSLDGESWVVAIEGGEIRDSFEESVVRLRAPVRARFFRFVARAEANGGPWTSAAELGVVRSAR